MLASVVGGVTTGPSGSRSWAQVGRPLLDPGESDGPRNHGHTSRGCLQVGSLRRYSRAAGQLTPSTSGQGPREPRAEPEATGRIHAIRGHEACLGHLFSQFMGWFRGRALPAGRESPSRMGRPAIGAAPSGPA